MILTKASPIAFDRKDLDLVCCPKCQGVTFVVHRVTVKSLGTCHLHLTCILCDVIYCVGENREHSS